MANPEIVYATALAALRKAESDYAEAESKLIQARRAVTAVEGATKYAQLLKRHNVAETP